MDSPEFPSNGELLGTTGLQARKKRRRRRKKEGMLQKQTGKEKAAGCMRLRRSLAFFCNLVE